VRGTVGEREIGSNVIIQIIDSEGERVEYAFPDITADNDWQQSFTPGEETNLYSEQWIASGNYRMEVSYSVPGEGFEIEELEFVFSYDANPGIAIETTADGERQRQWCSNIYESRG
jgi:hypothetical protein